MTITVKEYNHLAVGHPDNPKPFPICGSRTRQDISQPFCTQKAGWGTSHEGEGRCKLHGGSSPAGVHQPNYKNGRYARRMKGELKKRLESMETVESDVLDVIPELQVSQAVFSVNLERFEKMLDAGELEKKKDLLEYVGFIQTEARSIVATVKDIIQMRNESAITKAELVYLRDGLKRAIEKHIPDVDKQRAFLADLREFLPTTDK